MCLLSEKMYVFLSSKIALKPSGKRGCSFLPPSMAGQEGRAGGGGTAGVPKTRVPEKERQQISKGRLRTPDTHDRATPAARPSSCTSRLPRSCGIPYTLTRTPSPSPENKLSGVNVTEPQPSRDLGAAGPRNSGQATCGPVSSRGGAGPARGDGRAPHAQALFPWQQQSSQAFDTVFKNTGAATLT